VTSQREGKRAARAIRAAKRAAVKAPKQKRKSGQPANLKVTAKRVFRRYRAIEQLHEASVKAYETHAKRLVAAIVSYVEDEIVKGPLSKAGPAPVGLLTPAQLEVIRQLIIDFHLGFVSEAVATSLVPPELIDHLESIGAIPKGSKGGSVSLRMIDEAFYYGKSIVTLGKVNPRTVETLSLDDYRRYPKARLTPIEQRSLEWARHATATEIKGLGNKIADDFSTTAIEADNDLRREYRTRVTEAVTDNIETRQQWREIASELGHATKDWARDFRRIAATEKSKALQEGLALELLSGDPAGDGSETYVAKIPSPDACPHCIALHLTAGPGSPPRVFALSELIGNGTNHGRKAADWKATVGPAHPWCHGPGALVLTARGELPLALLRPGDLVLTHEGRFAPIERIAKRVHRGNFVQIAINDQLLEATPEHPYLTQRGWVAASKLRPGDQLMAIHDHPVLDVDANNYPTKCFEIARLLDILRGFALGRVPVGVHFYGQEDIKQRQVDVEWAYRELRRRIESGVLQELADLFFVFGHAAFSLSRLGRSELLDEWTLFASTRNVRIGVGGAPFLGRHTGPAQSKSLAGGSDSDTVFAEALVDRFGADSMPFCQGFSAISSLVRVDDFFDGEWGALVSAFIGVSPNQPPTDGISRNAEALCELRNRGTPLVGVDQGFDINRLHNDQKYHGAVITAIQTRPYEGHVYSLRVPGPESYIVDGFAVHNCGCELVEIPEGWGFDEDGELQPQLLKRSDFFDRDLRKAAIMTYQDVPSDSLIARVPDPQWLAVIDKVAEDTPPKVFRKESGVTLIVMDSPRPGVALDHGDLAYWTGNEIRLAPHVPLSKLEDVLRHEIAHSLAIHVQTQLGDIPKVKKWMGKLYSIAKEEGFVSKYAKQNAIENHAEATRVYLYDRKRLMLTFPRTFAALHRYYRDLL